MEKGYILQYVYLYGQNYFTQKTILQTAKVEGNT